MTSNVNDINYTLNYNILDTELFCFPYVLNSEVELIKKHKIRSATLKVVFIAVEI